MYQVLKKRSYLAEHKVFDLLQDHGTGTSPIVTEMVHDGITIATMEEETATGIATTIGTAGTAMMTETAETETTIKEVSCLVFCSLLFGFCPVTCSVLLSGAALIILQHNVPKFLFF